MVYLITYDLNKPGKEYRNLYSALRQFDYIRDNGLDSVWFISTSWSASQVYNFLHSYIDSSDRIFVTKLHRGEGEHEGWLHKDMWKWINARL